MAAACCTIESPVGPLTITAADGAITAVDFAPPRGPPPPAAPPPGAPPRPNGGVLAEAARQLTEYFAGTLRAFDLPLVPQGTSFRRRVWAAMQAIPYGQTRSYGDLARDLDSAPRAVGGACGANPIPLIIPCHRVVGAGGALGGFSGSAGCDTKRQLLALEGALPPQLSV